MEDGSTAHPTFEDALVAVGLSAPDRTRAETTVLGRLGLDPADFVWHTTPGTREVVGARSQTENNLIWVTNTSVTIHRELKVNVTPDGHRPNGFARYNYDRSEYVAGSRGRAQQRSASEAVVCPRCFLTHASECL